MTYLTLPENNENIDLVANEFASGTNKMFERELYGLGEKFDYKTRLAFLSINALNYYDPLDEYNYLTREEALLIMSKFTNHVY